MFPSALSLRDNMAGILSSILRLPANGKPVTIIDLSALPSETLNVVVSLVSRMGVRLRAVERRDGSGAAGV